MGRPPLPRDRLVFISTVPTLGRFPFYEAGNHLPELATLDVGTDFLGSLGGWQEVSGLSSPPPFSPLSPNACLCWEEELSLAKPGAHSLRGHQEGSDPGGSWPGCQWDSNPRRLTEGVDSE